MGVQLCRQASSSIHFSRPRWRWRCWLAAPVVIRRRSTTAALCLSVARRSLSAEGRKCRRPRARLRQPAVLRLPLPVLRRLALRLLWYVPSLFLPASAHPVSVDPLKARARPHPRQSHLPALRRHVPSQQQRRPQHLRQLRHPRRAQRLHQQPVATHLLHAHPPFMRWHGAIRCIPLPGITASIIARWHW